MFLGLDLGTSGIKGLLIDDGQTIIGQATAPLTVSRPQSGWSEQAPADWITACEAVFSALGQAHDLSTLKGIGLSGQMHGATLLDRADNVLRPCILWNDTRAAAEAEMLDGDPQFQRIAGNIVFPGFTAPKLVWAANHEPALFAKVAKVLLPKDYLRLWLTGAHVSEMSDAAGTAWLDVAARDWSDDLLAETGLTREHMPTLVEGSAPSGTLRDTLADRFGLPKGIIVAGGGGDNAASAIGMGCLEEGQAFASLGTSGVLFAANDAYRPNPASAVHTFCHAAPDRWHQMGVILAATDALNWFAKVAGSDAQALTAPLGPLQAPGRALFLPYLGGERTPHNDAGARGAMIGLDHADDASTLARAVMEGVAFAFADCRDALAAAGTTLERVTAVGGGSKSEYWCAVLASTLGIPVDLPEAGDFGGAFGAARLGLCAATGADVADVATAPKIARTIKPDAELITAFADKHQTFKAAYTALKEF
ncbi:xylulokinase [Rubricella aquisinus]|uniref:Xylulose kinase n=1 Tax=Rubricella aquisinus TaxID=2028108 RepID=A0A840WL36_9RHOB|nr:xylulokinase [Rubricella aquisinus]MBB5514372.1 xylulokinase [Rubricella aquisinus]